MGHLYQPKLKNGNRSSIYWIKMYAGRIDGRDTYRRFSTGETELERAEKKLAIAEHDEKRGELTIARPERLRYEDLRAAALTYYSVNEARNVKEVGRRLTHLDPFFGRYRAIVIDAPLIEEYKALRKAQGAANGTLNREVGVLGKMLSLAVEDGRVARKPKIRKLDEKAAVRRGFVEQQAFDRIMKHLAPDLQLAALTAYTLAWRMKSEVLKLRWQDVDLTFGTVSIPTSKNDDPRRCRITPELLVRLKEHRARMLEVFGKLPEHVFVRLPHAWAQKAKVGSRLFNIDVAWRQACQRAAIDGDTPELATLLIHDLRRSGVRNLVRSGVTEGVAMSFSGHRSRDVFERYNIGSDDDQVDAMTKVQAFQNGMR